MNKKRKEVEGEIKQVVIVREELKMGKGKIAAQVAHASLQAYKIALEKFPEIARKWERMGAKKIVLKASLDEILKLKKIAEKRGLPHSLIIDAGLTQVPPGSITALAIGPAYAEELKETEKLKLL